MRFLNAIENIFKNLNLFIIRTATDFSKNLNEFIIRTIKEIESRISFPYSMKRKIRTDVVNTNDFF